MGKYLVIAASWKKLSAYCAYVCVYCTYIYLFIIFNKKDLWILYEKRHKSLYTGWWCIFHLMYHIISFSNEWAEGKTEQKHPNKMHHNRFKNKFNIDGLFLNYIINHPIIAKEKKELKKENQNIFIKHIIHILNSYYTVSTLGWVNVGKADVGATKSF